MPAQSFLFAFSEKKLKVILITFEKIDKSTELVDFQLMISKMFDRSKMIVLISV